MNTPRDETENTYVLDPNAPAEVQRLLMQSDYLNKLMHEPLAEQSNPQQFKAILDIGCGPGEWCRMLGNTFPDASIVGIDISEQSIQYATMKAKTRQLSNVEFRQMNVLKPLVFPDASFDLVNIRLAFGFMPHDSWPLLFKECSRVLRLGGALRVTELERGHSPCEGWEKTLDLFSLALKKTGKGHSATGTGFGLVSALRPLLLRSGFRDIQMVPYIWDVIYGESGHQIMLDDFKSGFGQLQPYLAEHTGTPFEDVKRYYEQGLLEMQSEDIGAVSFLLTAWGRKAG